MQARKVAIVAEINGQDGQFIGKNNDTFQWKQQEVVYFSMWRQLECYCCLVATPKLTSNTVLNN